MKGESSKSASDRVRRVGKVLRWLCYAGCHLNACTGCQQLTTSPKRKPLCSSARRSSSAVRSGVRPEVSAAVSEAARLGWSCRSTGLEAESDRSAPLRHTRAGKAIFYLWPKF